MSFKANQNYQLTLTKVQPITLTRSWHYPLANEANHMSRERPEREIQGCQLGFIAGVFVHEQSANNAVTTHSNEVWAIFTRAT